MSAAPRSCLLVGLLALLGLASAASAQAAPDLASDPRDEVPLADLPLLPRFPGAWLVAGTDQPAAPRTLALGPVERKRREVRIGASQQFTAALRERTYQVPRSVSLAALAAHYEQRLRGRLLYQCRGRDCGRSNEWANAIFGNAALYGPDADQYYFAAQQDDALLAVYLIRRGNRRLYAHHVRYEPTEPVDLIAIPDQLGDLRRLGRYRIPGVWPDRDGTLTEAELDELRSLAPKLAALDVPALYVVCHVYARDRVPPPEGRRPRQRELRDDSAAVGELVAAAERCADTAAGALTLPDGPALRTFGVGPLAPSAELDDSRVVLVLPRID
ncbi:MAG: DUF4892 domain-containing protein [Pseudomonadota bacterium]